MKLIFTAAAASSNLTPHRFENGFRTADPHGAPNKANSEDVLLDHIRRGHSVWMSREGNEPVLIEPKMVTVQFR